MTDLTIHKYRLPIDDTTDVSMPSGAQVLAVAPSHTHETLWLWALVHPDAEHRPHRFYIRGTGHPHGAAIHGHHVATVQAPPFVWHVFESHGE